MLFATLASCLSFIACAHAHVLAGPALAGPSSSTLKPLAKHTSSTLASTSSPISLETPVVDGHATTETSGDASYWLADIKHQGLATYNSDPSTYTVFRNVKDYGAKGNAPQRVVYLYHRRLTYSR